jgi:hypothetical protein
LAGELVVAELAVHALVDPEDLAVVAENLAAKRCTTFVLDALRYRKRFSKKLNKKLVRHRIE